MSVSEKWTINQNWYEVEESNYGTKVKFNEEFEPEKTKTAAQRFANYAETNLNPTDLYEKAINMILGKNAILSQGEEVILANRSEKKAEETLRDWYLTTYED